MWTGTKTDFGIVLDVQAIQWPGNAERGIGRYTIELSRELVRRDVVQALFINPSLPFPGHVSDDIALSPLLQWNTATNLRRILKERPVAYHIFSPLEYRGGDGSNGITGHIPLHVLNAGIPITASLYDLIVLDNPERYLPDREMQVRFARRLELLQGLDLILAISEFTRQEVIKHLDIPASKVVAIGTGVSDFFCEQTPAAEKSPLIRDLLPEIKRNIVMTVATGSDSRKNVETLIAAYSKLPEPLRQVRQLVIVGASTPEMRQQWKAIASSCQLSETEVIFTGFVDDNLLRTLYQTAELFVFPSIQEGFGLPAAEAMACGCPTIGSNRTSVPEILASKEAEFDPLDADDMARCIEHALTDSTFYADLKRLAKEQTKHRRWDTVAQREIEAVSKLFDRRPKRGSHLPRIALVGPLPPAESGIADYNYRLVAELGKISELDILVPQSDEAPALMSVPHARVFHLSQLGRLIDPSTYDAIIYTIGNSYHHVETYEMAQRYPGIVWFHDVRLGHLYHAYAAQRLNGHNEQFLRTKVLESYGSRVPQVNSGDWNASFWQKYGVGMTAELQRSARAVLVNSKLAARLHQLDIGPDAPSKPLFSFSNLAFPPVLPGPEIDELSPRNLIASFGIVDPIKSPDLLIAAMPLVRRHLPEARLIFVGSIGPKLLEDLQRQTRDLGIEDGVEFTGRIGHEEYRESFKRIACAVQLRRSTNGESSAPLTECVARGIPCITNIAGAEEAYPPGVLEILPSDFRLELLAERIVQLLSDNLRWSRQRKLGLDHAQANGFSALARDLTGIVAELTAAAPAPVR